MDGVISEDEAQTITLLKQKMEKFQDKLQNLISPKQKQKAIDAALKMAENVDKMLEKINRAIGKVGN